MKPLMMIFAVCLTTLNLGSAAASDRSEMNVRESLNNSSKNKIISARLIGLVGGKTDLTKIGAIGQSENTCNTTIGNTDGGSSLTGETRDIIVVGDVINIC